LPNLLPQREPDPEPDNDVSFLPSVSQGTGVPQPEEQDKDKPEEPKTGSGSEKQRQEREKVEALIQELGNNTVIPARLGLPYFFGEHDPQLRRIATTLVYRNRSVEWLTSLVRWAKGGDSKDRESRFWKGKLQTGTAAVEKLAGFLETGALAEQFDAMLVATKGSDVFDALRENPWLLRTYPHLAPQPAEKDYGKPLCAGGNLIGYMAKEEPEPGSMEEFMALNRAKAGAGFEPEEAE
jgi:hypothetical protein